VELEIDRDGRLVVEYVAQVDAEGTAERCRRGHAGLDGVRDDVAQYCPGRDGVALVDQHVRVLVNVNRGAADEWQAHGRVAGFAAAQHEQVDRAVQQRRVAQRGCGQSGGCDQVGVLGDRAPRLGVGAF
jgi:hypothetical protein